MAEYQLFPDIKLMIGRHDTDFVSNGTEISFCISGICEYSIGQKYYYLKAKNCIVLRSSSDMAISYSSDYCGITLLIDSQFKSTAFSEILDMQDIMRKMSHGESCIFSADEKIEKLFSDIYKEQETSKAEILRIKVLELLMLLSEQKTAHCEQQEIIEQVGAFIGSLYYFRAFGDVRYQSDYAEKCVQAVSRLSCVCLCKKQEDVPCSGAYEHF